MRTPLCSWGFRRWRHIDVGFARCVLEGSVPRVACSRCGSTVAGVPWARHDAVFTRAFEEDPRSNQRPTSQTMWAYRVAEECRTL